MEKIESTRDQILESIEKDYGKLMNPMRKNFNFTIDDLISYLNCAK